MGEFEYRNLRVYAEAIQVIGLAYKVTRTLPRHCWGIADQLMRAVFSIVLNIAEGAEEFAPREKARFYRMARRSAAEASAAFDVLLLLNAAIGNVQMNANKHLESIGAMLTRMIKVQEARPDRDRRWSRRHRPSPSPSPGPRPRLRP